MILPGETEAGTAGLIETMNGGESSFLRRPTSIGSKDLMP